VRKHGAAAENEQGGATVSAISTPSAMGQTAPPVQASDELHKPARCPGPPFDSVFDELAYRTEQVRRHSYLGETPSVKAITDDAQLVLAVREREGLIDDERRTRHAWHRVRTAGHWVGLLLIVSVGAATLRALVGLDSVQFAALLHDCLAWHPAPVAVIGPWAGWYWFGRRRGRLAAEQLDTEESKPKRSDRSHVGRDDT
jgi:hypothetical protein